MPAQSDDTQHYTSLPYVSLWTRRKEMWPMFHVSNSTIRPQGHHGPFSSLVLVWCLVCLLNVESFEIRYFGKLALRQSSVLTSHLGVVTLRYWAAAAAAAARGLTCRVQLHKYFVSCQHHWNISVGVKPIVNFFFLTVWLCVAPMPHYFMDNAFSVA